MFSRLSVEVISLLFSLWMERCILLGVTSMDNSASETNSIRWDANKIEIKIKIKLKTGLKKNDAYPCSVLEFGFLRDVDQYEQIKLIDFFGIDFAVWIFLQI